MARLSVDFRPKGLDRTMMAKSVIFLVIFTGLLTPFADGQLLQPNKEVICNFVSCVGWCECTGADIDISQFLVPFFDNVCSLGDFIDFGTCPNDPNKVVIAQNRDSNVKNCVPDRLNPLVFFKNETNGTDYALRAWDANHPDSYVLLSEFCAPQCNPICGIALPPTPTPFVPMTTRMTTGRQIDVIIPRKPEPTGSGLSPADARILGIALGVFFVGLLICLIVVFVCYWRRKNNKNRAPKLPPRRNMPNQNRDYATIEEIQMMSANNSPARRGGAYPNGLYRSESLSAINSFNPDPSINRSVSDIELLGDPPHPPVRQMSLLPGVNPALADCTDGPGAPQDDYGYTKYLPESDQQGLPYMHLKVTPSLSDPEGQHQAPKPHRYRSNTADTHANSADVGRAIDRIRARQALKDGGNRRFVPNQTGRGRSTTLGDDYNRLNRNGHTGVPRTRKNDSAAFTPVPVHGQYQSRPRRSPESVRRWRSLPDMTDGGQAPPTMQADSVDENTPVYQLLERSPASSIGDYSKRKTYQLPNGHDETDLPEPRARDSRGSGRTASESGPSSHGSQSQGSTMDDRYDPVYESRLSNNTKVPQSPNEYQPLSQSRPVYLEFDDHPAADEAALDSDSYLKPNKSHRSPKENGKLNGGRGGMRAPNAPNAPNAPSNGHLRDSMQDTAYIYGGDNNNLSLKKQPSKTVGGNSYAALKLRQTEDGYDNPNDNDDEMESGEYMYHPAGPDVMA